MIQVKKVKKKKKKKYIYIYIYIYIYVYKGNFSPGKEKLKHATIEGEKTLMCLYLYKAGDIQSNDEPIQVIENIFSASSLSIYNVYCHMSS